MPVYFIGQVMSNNCTHIKIGRTSDISRRRGQLQTGSPYPLEIMGWIHSDNDAALERQLHLDFATRRQVGEWFQIEPGEILPILMAEGDNGFIAKNADAFEIAGHDRHGVPEYLGVWAWGELEFQDCCPFCGCFCGMQYQEASSMYYCMSCDTLTDFSELSRDDEE